MAKSGLTTDEKVELALAQINYINEQMSQMIANWAANMVDLMEADIDAGTLAKASKDKIKVEISADHVKYKAKMKK